MNLERLFPLLDVEEVTTETESRETNALIRKGWSLLLTYPSPDGVGGFFCVYVLGKRRPATTRAITERDEFDQRIEG